jgi:hypothetical protein
MSSGIIELIINEYEWISESYGLGFYIFNIRVNIKSNPYTIKRRFSDIEWLNKNIIRYSKGCRLPKLPEKTLWVNISIHKDNIVKTRKLQIQEYLDFIINHKYLSLNPYFEKFIANTNILIKDDTDEKSSIFNKIVNYFPSNFFFKFSKTSVNQEDSIYDNNDKLYFQRLSKGINEIIKQYEEYYKININKTDSLHKIKTFSLAISKFSETKFQTKDNSIITNTMCLSHIEEIDSDYNRSLKEKLERLRNYYSKIISIEEIFDRLGNFILISDDENNEENKKSINEFREQIEYEINDFKVNDESPIIKLIEEIIQLRVIYNKNIQNVFKK